MITEHSFPKRYTKFSICDFFQIEVDGFMNGRFLFLSAKEVETKTSEETKGVLENVGATSWIVSTYCYTNKCYWKILVCDFKAKPWKNNYTIRSSISNDNGCDGYAVNEGIKEFLSWLNPLPTDNRSVATDADSSNVAG